MRLKPSTSPALPAIGAPLAISAMPAPNSAPHANASKVFGRARAMRFAPGRSAARTARASDAKAVTRRTPAASPSPFTIDDRPLAILGAGASSGQAELEGPWSGHDLAHGSPAPAHQLDPFDARRV